MRSQGGGDYERFVALAFAGANMVAEIDAAGTLIYAAGDFQLEFGRPPESFVGCRLGDIIAPIDHDVLEAALLLLAEKGRLAPMTIRLGNSRRTKLAIAGLALPVRDGPPRLCISFAMLPAPLNTGPVATTRALSHAAEARMRAGSACDLGLIEISSRGQALPDSGEIGHALSALAPDDLAAEIAPGRFGLLGGRGDQAGLLRIATLLEAALQAQGIEVAVASSHLPLETAGLTPFQAARALRQALNIYMRQGGAGFARAGLSGGLAGYLARAGAHTGALRRAIQEGRFDIAFQPIVVLANRNVHHYEALIRPEPVAGCNFAGPQEFILLIEALGLAGELDLEIARRTCMQAEKTGTQIAFNLSSQSVQDPGFRERLIAMLSASPAVKSGLMIVEMTETAEIHNVTEAALTARALRAAGVPFYLDDFGAGTSDVRLLRALNADVVKLDGSYLAGIIQPGRERDLVAGIVKIARGAGAQVLAERVETEREADELLDLGVHFGQGWLFGRPAPLPAAPKRAAIAGRPVAGAQRGSVSGNWR